MLDIVVDASVLVKWFRVRNETHVDVARAIRTRFERGEYRIVVPFLLFLEMLNQGARRWRMPAYELDDFAFALATLGLTVIEPSIGGIARWCARGLTAYDASYVTLAEERGTVVITDDQQMIATGGRFVRALADEPR